MKSEELSKDLLEIMRVVREKGGTDCSGSCHHRKPGEFHCHTLAQMLGMSSSGIKARLRSLVNMGLMERHRIESRPGNPIVRFVVAPDGEKVLSAHNDGLLREQGCPDASSNA